MLTVFPAAIARVLLTWSEGSEVPPLVMLIAPSAMVPPPLTTTSASFAIVSVFAEVLPKSAGELTVPFPVIVPPFAPNWSEAVTVGLLAVNDSVEPVPIAMKIDRVRRVDRHRVR